MNSPFEDLRLDLVGKRFYLQDKGKTHRQKGTITDIRAGYVVFTMNSGEEKRISLLKFLQKIGWLPVRKDKQR